MNQPSLQELLNNQAVDSSWTKDVLGEGFEQLELVLTDNEVATLVRYQSGEKLEPDPVAADADVLYLLGWSDCFLQQKLAHFRYRNGARFFALALHNQGRSLRAGNTPGFVAGISRRGTTNTGPPTGASLSPAPSSKPYSRPKVLSTPGSASTSRS